MALRTSFAILRTMYFQIDALVFDSVSNSECQEQLAALLPSDLKHRAFARLAYSRFFKEEVW